MVQGATSGAGKSFLAAGLCRLYARRGLRVAPFKAQNMALNAAVTVDGGEIGRAQAVQAEAAGVPAEVAMNPVLLKAEGDSTCQVVLMGRVLGSVGAGAYRSMRAELWPRVASALLDLRRRFDLVVIEGAGSPAEVNLREGEIVNMRVAAAAGGPVLLAADIERGGVFAALLGTLDLLSPSERGRVKALVVNRFRGDPALFADGVAFLEERSGLPVLGVVPHLDVRLPAEDSLDLERLASEPAGGVPAHAVIDVAVIRLGRISNFDELEPLAAEPGVRLRLVAEARDLGRPDLVVLPGSKTTAADLAHLRESGLAGAILGARARGAALLGICGGYQMLGREIQDPEGVEGVSAHGLGLLPAVTVFEPTKVTTRREGRVRGGPGLLARCAGIRVRGYQIHMGRVDGGPPVIDLAGGSDGCASEDGWVVGTSLHGLLGNAGFRRALLETLAERRGVALPPPAPVAPDPFDRLADALEASLDLPLLNRLVGVEPPMAEGQATAGGRGGGARGAEAEGAG
jgi:adenosylcobyric acid synthase